MKYIDADKLKAAINDKVTRNKMFVLNLIDSIQQEQPVDGDDGKFVKISVRKEVAEQFQKLGDVILAGQSSFIRAMNQQEQPEVDLEKEIKDYTETLYHETFGNGQGTLDEFDWENIVQVIDDMARYFYNLNKNDA